MIAKFVALICLFGLARAGGWQGAGYASSAYPSGIGYGLGGYSTYVAPSYTVPVVTKAVYTAPVVTKAVVPTYSYAAYAPAISTVSRYQVHSSPVVKTYVAAPVSAYSTYTAAYPVSIGHGYSAGYPVGYAGGYSGGYSGYGYGGHGYGIHGAKYLW